MKQSQLLLSFPEIVHGISTSDEGNMSYNWGELKEVNSNRKEFVESLGLRIEDGVSMSLVHGSEIVQITSADRGRGMINMEHPECDALMTNEKGLYFFMNTADCLPIFFYSPEKEVIALAHCGWKGTDLWLARKVVEEMEKVYRVRSEELKVVIGPGIHKESYILDDPVQKGIDGWGQFVKVLTNGKYSVDIVGYNEAQLISVGVLQKNIKVMDFDTGSDKIFFSHYRSVTLGEVEGRFCSVLGMR